MAGRKAAEGSGNYAQRIRDARQGRGMNQQALADALGVNRVTVAGWETGHSRPDLDSLPALFRALGISPGAFFGFNDALSPGERKIINAFRSLDSRDQQALIWQAEALAAGRLAEGKAIAANGRAEDQRAGASSSGQMAAKQQPEWEKAKPNIGLKETDAGPDELKIEELKSRVVSLYRSDLSAAAGVSAGLDSERGEQIWLRRDELTARADEIIPVNGRSMEPTFRDGEEVLVEHTDSLREGEIGVFLADGEGYIKEYRRDGLHSHNPDYKTMYFSDENDVRCIGRVLGRVEKSQRLTDEEINLMEESK